MHRAIAVPPDIADDDAADIEHDLGDRRRPDLVLTGDLHWLAAVAMVEHGTVQGSVETTTGLVVASAFIGLDARRPVSSPRAEARCGLRARYRGCLLWLRLADSAAERRRATKEPLQQIAEGADLARI